MFATEFEFTLPCGFLDEEGTLHKEGVMRRATAADEILPLKDPRVVKNEAYVIVILLSRVITRLGSVASINPKVIESLFATDLAFLQTLYNKVNRYEDTAEICPHCEKPLEASRANGEGARLGESSATPSVN
ncbi:MAG TPA: hypothetical protein VFS24_10325 [Steroidobacteraceae bacterium]|nr:hypothetical protein [Steroidobacteraceae bacterium]